MCKNNNYSHSFALCGLILCSGLLFAQTEEKPVSIGVAGGVGLNDPFQATDVNILTPSNIRYSFANHRYIIGPTFQVNLPLHLGLEIDGLYRRYSYTSDAVTFGGIATTSTSANTWEFPVLLKYRVFRGPVSPFLVGGANFRYVGSTNQSITVTSLAPGNVGSTVVRELENRWAPGFTVGGGISVGPRYLRIEPQIRYTRWGWDNFVSDPAGFFKSNQNQVDFLVNLRF